MIKMYNTDINTNITEETKDLKKGNWINMISPTEEEIQRVCAALQIKQDFIRYSLDEEEKARIDTEDDDNTTLYIIDIPVIESDRTRRVYVTMPIGVIFVRDDYIITVSQKNNDIIKDIKTENVITYKKSRFLLQILYANSKKFLSLLYKINKELESTENKLKNSLQNEGLLKMLDLEKSLVYFTTSLKSNEVVMEKTTRGKIIKLYEEDEDLLEDAIIENKQAIEMAKIYSDILSGTMDTYASIISNNLNAVMKILTSVTFILAIPTLIASIWGMNVELPFQREPLGFLIITVFSIIMCIVATIWLKRKRMLN
ncbi:MAG TPA: magnesium transporter CorA family protein [Clostridiaceae bacterium]|jgi:magnesium transporter|nr:magnesium transporter CorA family protein [Clostridia bacterium]HCF64766.1 magnesium transporter [Clostridiales bacterium]HJJ09964.1 magnesium transporter CorA family protein [Clostridiaceae bacterium]